MVYLGDQANVTDGQNFTDISSFKFTGYVYYHDLHDKDGDGDFTERSDFPVESVVVKIDGEPVITNGDIVTTDSDGKYCRCSYGRSSNINRKNGHTFKCTLSRADLFITFKMINQNLFTDNS